MRPNLIRNFSRYICNFPPDWPIFQRSNDAIKRGVTQQRPLQILRFFFFIDIWYDTDCWHISIYIWTSFQIPIWTICKAILPFVVFHVWLSISHGGSNVNVEASILWSDLFSFDLKTTNLNIPSHFKQILPFLTIIKQSNFCLANSSNFSLLPDGAVSM